MDPLLALAAAADDVGTPSVAALAGCSPGGAADPVGFLTPAPFTAAAGATSLSCSHAAVAGTAGRFPAAAVAPPVGVGASAGSCAPMATAAAPSLLPFVGTAAPASVPPASAVAVGADALFTVPVGGGSVPAGSYPAAATHVAMEPVDPSSVAGTCEPSSDVVAARAAAGTGSPSPLAFASATAPASAVIAATAAVTDALPPASTEGATTPAHHSVVATAAAADPVVPALSCGTVAPDILPPAAAAASAARASSLPPVAAAGKALSGSGAPATLDAANGVHTQPRRVVLPELARLGADKFCSEVIRNMRSAGRMLLSSSVVFPAFERVSVVLSTSSDPSRLIILDCAEHAAPVRDRVDFSKALSSQMPSSGGGRRVGVARAASKRLRKASRKAVAKNSHAAQERSDSGTQSAWDSAGADQGADKGGAAFKNHEASERPSAGDDLAGADSEQPVVGLEADLDALVNSRSLARSLLNDGPVESDSQRSKETVTSGMVERFLHCSGLPDLNALTFSMCIELWKTAMELKNEMVAASGVPRDWRSLCPSELFTCNWALTWSTPQTEPVADRTCLFPPRNARVKCSIGSRRVALVVATSLCLFWNMAVRRYFAENPFLASDGEDDKDNELDTLNEEQDTPEVGQAKPLAERGDDGPDPAPTSVVVDRAADGGAADNGARGGRSAVDVDVDGKGNAGQQPGAVNVSAKDVLRVGRRGDAAAHAATYKPQRKKQKLADHKESPPRPLGGNPPAPLVRRPMLGAKVTGAPPQHPSQVLEPPTPPRGSRMAPAAMKFNLRRTVEAGRLSTIAVLMNRWAVVASTRPDDGFSVRVCGAREYEGIVQRQDEVSLLLPRDVLESVCEKRHAIYTSGQSVDERPALDRAVVEVSVKGATYRLPYAAMALMAELHRINEDYAIAGQSSLWLEQLGNQRGGTYLVDPEHDPFLMPARTSLTRMKAVVKSALGGTPLLGVIWKRSVRPVVDPTSGEVVDLQSSWALDARTFVSAARPVWLKCSFVDPVLVELGSWASGTGNGVYVMTCEKFTSMLRTPQGTTTDLADAKRLGMRWAVGAGRCTRLATMVNHDNSHWCAAVIHLSNREIVFYDSLASNALDAESEFSLGRLRLLGNCALAVQAEGEGQPSATIEWATRQVSFPRQTDAVSCGLFALQFLVQQVTGSTFELVGDEAGLLRLVFLHAMVLAGRAPRE